jgi:hypothetical protein
MGGKGGGLLNTLTLGLLGTPETPSQAPIIIHQPAPASGGVTNEQLAQKIEETKAPKDPKKQAPTPRSAPVQQAKKKQRRAAASGGRRRNVLTSGRGLETTARTTRKTLLGQ